MVYSGSLAVTIGKPPIRLGLRSLWSNAVNFMYHNKIQGKTTDITFYWPRNMERSSWRLFSLQLSFHKMAWIPSVGGPPYGCTQNPDTVCIKVLWEVLKDRDHSKHKTQAWMRILRLKGLKEVTWTKSNAHHGLDFTHAHRNITWTTAGIGRQLISVKQQRKKGTKHFQLFFFFLRKQDFSPSAHFRWLAWRHMASYNFLPKVSSDQATCKTDVFTG